MTHHNSTSTAKTTVLTFGAFILGAVLVTCIVAALLHVKQDTATTHAQSAEITTETINTESMTLGTLSAKTVDATLYVDPAGESNNDLVLDIKNTTENETVSFNSNRDILIQNHTGLNAADYYSDNTALITPQQTESFPVSIPDGIDGDITVSYVVSGDRDLALTWLFDLDPVTGEITRT